MAGVMSLMQPQGQQGPMPGQAQQQPMQGMMPQQGAPTPQAMVDQLATMPFERLEQFYSNPQPKGPPLYAVISAIVKQQKAAQMAQEQQGQQAMAQNAQMQQQPPVAAQAMQQARQTLRPQQMPQEPVMAAQGGIMQGYAGGGAVAFFNGGDTEVERILKKGPYERTPEENEILRAAGVKLAQRQGGSEDSFLSRLNKGLGNIFGRTTPAPEETASYDHEGRIGLASKPTPPVPPAPAPMQPARRLPAGNKPSAMSQGLGFLAEQPSTPGPDTLSDIESGGIRDIKALQDVIRQQGAVDPELMKLREAAYKSSQGIAERRERDRLAGLEAAQKQYADPTDLLIGLAGGAGGRTALDVLRGAVGGVGAARTAKRAELQKAQEVSRQEQKANEDLTQALAEKRVADMTGDVNQRREADRKVAEAQLKVTDLRSGIQKERAVESDRAEQRKIAREQIAAQLQSAKIGAAAKEGAAGIAEQRLALQAMRADPNYAAIVKELTEAKKLAGVSSSPMLQARLRAAEKAAKDLATSYGVTPGMMGMGGAPAPAGDREIDFNAIGKK